MTAPANQTSRSTPRIWVREQAAAGHAVWAVVDAAADMPKPVRKLLDRSGYAINLLAHRTSDESALELAPRLISVDENQLQPVFEQLWQEQAVDEPVVFFLSTALDAATFENCMRQRVRAELPDGDAMLFRWWDVRIWWALHQLPRSEHPEVAVLLEPCAASLWLARDGEVQCSYYAGSDVAFADGSESIKIGSLTLDVLLELGEADAVLGICREQYPSALDLVVPEQRHGLACRQIEWSVAQGFLSPDDHALAVRIAAELGPAWHQQAEWMALVAAAQAEGSTLLAKVAAA